MFFSSEARMRAPGHRWIATTLIFIVASSLGCRGSRPFGRVVQVTQETDASLPDIAPPRQRLATTKPREESVQSAKQAVAGDRATTRASTSGSAAMPVSAKTASATGSASRPPKNRQVLATPQPAPSQSTRARPSSSSALASKPPSLPQTNSTASYRRLSDQPRQPTPDRVADSASKSRPASGANATAKTATAQDPEVAEIMATLSNWTPEARIEMMRQLEAVTSRSPDRTSQPNSLDAQLAKDVLNSHDLPEAKNTVPEVPPTRIASGQPSKPSDETHSPEPGGRDAAADKAMNAGVTDLVTSELDSTVVTSISDTVESDDSQVKPASASSSRRDESMIAHASIDPSLPGERAEANAEPQSNPLSEQELFTSLRKRLSTPVEGESEAERSARLIRLRHLMVLSGDPDAAVKHSEGTSEAEEEFLRHQLLGLWTIIDPQGHPVASRRLTTALPQIREAAKFAAAATDSLEVRSLAFCTEIESYGQIKTFPGNRFDAGQQVILYCEIENFTVDKTDEGFQTHLQGSYDIYDEDNHKVVSQMLPADQQVSANYLRDYFIAYQMHLPQQLTAGTYRMQLTMEDVNGKKYGQASIPLQIAK
jgi:hypothetical protein